MRRIDTSTAVADLFGPGKNGFGDGNPALAILATRLNAAFFNAIQEEGANLVEGAGLALDPGDNTQWLQAIQLLGGKVLSKSVAGGAAVVLTTAESRNPIILLTGELTANINVVMPAVGREWVIANNTTGAFTVTVKTAAGSGVAVAQGASLHLYCDLVSVLQVGASFAPQAVVGQFSNLKASAAGLSSAVVITADELIVKNGSNQYQTLRNVNVVPTFAAAGANGLDAGAANSQTASTWYYLWVIWNGVTTAGLLSLSATAPALPAGYTHKARIGSVRTDSTVNKYPRPFVQAGNQVRYRVVAGSSVTGNGIEVMSGTFPKWTAIGVSAFVPPTAVAIVGAVYNVYNFDVAVAPNNAWDRGAACVYTPSGYGSYIQQFKMLLESTNIYGYLQSGGFIYCQGWEDNL
jgi:hypothetical protein